MQKYIIMSTDVYSDLDNEGRVEFKKIMESLRSDGSKIIFTSRLDNKIGVLSDIEIDNRFVYFLKREKLREYLKTKRDDQYTIVVGNRDQDMYMASTNKLLYVRPGWCKDFDVNVEKYGVLIRSLEKFKELLEVIDNQKSWYYRLDLDEKTTILSLTNAGTYGSHSSEELVMIEGFRDYLKNGKKDMQSILLLHFLAAVSNNPEFKDIKDWAIMPSSGKDLNEDMLLFKEKARTLMNGRKKENIFVRHTPTYKSHEERDRSKRLPCDRHFDTIKLHEKYKKSLKGRTVCVFDDYLTNGTTFETARNLLIKEGVKKIFFVSLGRFGKSYIKQDYEINGDVFNKYNYRLLNSTDMRYKGVTNQNAIREIENLYSIFSR